MLVEDDPVWRAMLTRFINNEHDLHVDQYAVSKEETISYCRQNKVDVVLMDINLTDNNLDGIQATLELGLMGIDVKVIALTSLDDEKVIINAYTAGAIHYVNKSDFRIIPEVIRGVLKAASPQEILVKEYLRLKKAEQYNKLTAAEIEIVELNEKGYARELIKEKLGKSEGTIKNQIASILKKFKARSMKEVIRTIRSRGLSDKEFER